MLFRKCWLKTSLKTVTSLSSAGVTKISLSTYFFSSGSHFKTSPNLSMPRCVCMRQQKSRHNYSITLHSITKWCLRRSELFVVHIVCRNTNRLLPSSNNIYFIYKPSIQQKLSVISQQKIMISQEFIVSGLDQREK